MVNLSCAAFETKRDVIEQMVAWRREVRPERATKSQLAAVLNGLQWTTPKSEANNQGHQRNDDRQSDLIHRHLRVA